MSIEDQFGCEHGDDLNIIVRTRFFACINALFHLQQRPALKRYKYDVVPLHCSESIKDITFLKITSIHCVDTPKGSSLQLGTFPVLLLTRGSLPWLTTMGCKTPTLASDMALILHITLI